MGDFKVGFSVGVYCTKCTINSGVAKSRRFGHIEKILRFNTMVLISLFIAIVENNLSSNTCNISFLSS
jgi:hypothetical protein